MPKNNIKTKRYVVTGEQEGIDYEPLYTNSLPKALTQFNKFKKYFISSNFYTVRIYDRKTKKYIKQSVRYIND